MYSTSQYIMPSFANYMIATQIKDYVIEHRDRLEKKYIVPLTFGQVLSIVLNIMDYTILLPIRFNYTGTAWVGE